MKSILTIILLSMLLVSCARSRPVEPVIKEQKALSADQNPSADLDEPFDTNDYLDESLKELEAAE